MKKARCTASLFVSCDYHTTPSPSWKKPHTRVRYSGIFPSAPHLSSIPNNSEVVRPSLEAAGFERRTHQFGMAARVPFGACTGTLGTIEATADVGERTSSVSPLHLEQTSLEPLPFGVDQPLCLRNGKVALLRSDLRSNKQCPGIPVQILFDIEIEGRASPTAPIVRTGAAAALETLGIAETGDIIGDGNRHAEIFGSVWDHISVKRSN